ncbi:bifunctional (p)ppGpp synthetase/guanosine-3',5'-bis(diphosphate) 3'-pyrophosphohydrolase [Castellaniella denitrificans]|uniref:Bifunctional (P)ppGpp synthetase/guanosine-3',5'-bis(Diphosphate) 3'-pyrophosphohydrolase n=1 Tax=Castellaniella denitrificans TaxID=56119 RepID=A0ABT4M5B8_9BURK|nr:bifunctional (p)ppGpp synthetase/guanosine-3',5'-bis(diphosphate) 3'-pyrophosphohydrolase [Castellaniella denitrificans]MCZ4330490.1 bifunctional (p)ppGpp synthetase/guanosine-3',5'-bis(diphosphate) 3'-pyrophosphohydrolase [Castellaniella denitrificans]
MAFSGLRGASSGLLAVLRKGPRLRRRKPHTTPAQQSEPAPIPIASLAGLNQIISGYLGPRDIERIREAYRFADNAHLGQFRASGEPYISHPIAVTEICAGWKLDADSLMAALLHDVIEDQNVSKQELAEKFGLEVAEIVDGLTKLERLEYATKAEQQAESFRKMLLAMARDVRVILIKLADRLHNMRTLDAVNPEKARRVARETLDIYTPIAHRLGLNALFRELQDRCFKAIHPNRYAVLHKAMMAARGNRREVISKIAEAVRAALPAAGLDAEVNGREKSLYGIYKKMVEQKKSFSDVLDIYGFRIIVHTLPECYLAMGTLHQLYRPVPGKFKDYIAIPKINGYQSLHTTLIGPYGTPVEFQFRTRDMDHVAEEGVASHWLYKEQGTSLNDLQKRTHQWLQSLLDIQSQTGDSGEFLEHVKVDLFPDAVYVFTPQGKILSLPRGATPVDFAYAIHTDVGNHAVASKINGEFSPLRTELHSGDSVEIVTSAASRPSAQWLNYVRTGRARSEIRHYLRNERYEESVAFGRRLLNQAFDQLSIPYPKDDDPQWERLTRGSGGASRTEILADIGLGKRLAAVVARRFAPENAMLETTAMAVDEFTSVTSAPIVIHGNEGQAVQLASCCGPLPGDAIIGGIRLGHGLVVHMSDCPVAMRQRAREPERWIPVIWDTNTARHLTTRLELTVLNERGVLGRLAAEITEAESNIIQLSMPDEAAATALLSIMVQVDSRKHLAQVIRAIRHVPQVQKIVRAKG